MSISNMRQALREILKYKGACTWVQRVNRMSDDQVLAVYLRMQRAGILRR